MDELTASVVELVKYTVSFSNLDIPSLYIKLDTNAIYVNDVTYEFNKEYLSPDDIFNILSQFRKMGAQEYKHTDDAVVFLDASLLLEHTVRN